MPSSGALTLPRIPLLPVFPDMSAILAHFPFAQLARDYRLPPRVVALAVKSVKSAHQAVVILYQSASFACLSVAPYIKGIKPV